VPTVYGTTDRDPTSESDPHLPQLSGDMNHPSKSPLVSDFDKRAMQRLANRVVSQAELPSVIERIVSSVEATDVVKRFQGNNAQRFIDVIDEARYHIVQSL